MTLKHLSLKSKMTAAVVAVCAVGFAAVTGPVTWIAVDAARRSAETIAQEMATRHAATVQADLTVSTDAARRLKSVTLV